METLDGNYSNIRKKIDRLENVLGLDLDKLMSGETNSAENMQSYYNVTDFAFKKFHSKYGFMHFHVSQNGKFSPEDAFYQPDTVARFIKPGDKVLELGFGKGANIFYLAKKCPDVEFTGLDLCTVHEKNTLPNVTLMHQDYQKLSNFADNTFDVIYGIETLCCCSAKRSAFREFNRVLKPGGHFIVYDYETPERFETYDRPVQTGIAFWTKGGAGAQIESEEEWLEHYRENNFKVESITDLSKTVLLDFKRLERLATPVIDSKTKAKLTFGILPDLLTNNVIIGYIGYDLYNEGFIKYKEWIMTK